MRRKPWEMASGLTWPWCEVRATDRSGGSRIAQRHQLGGQVEAGMQPRPEQPWDLEELHQPTGGGTFLQLVHKM